jgi:hypothetical protein
MIARTGPAADIEREPTPTVVVKDSHGNRWVTLHKGADYFINANDSETIENTASVVKFTGVAASLLAEIYLGSDRYPLFIFDRGRNSQGRETELIAGSQFNVSDRFLITDEEFLMTANLRSGTGRDFKILKGIAEMCVGSSMIFGRDYDHDGLFDTEHMPLSVSQKHAAVSIGYDNSVHITDTYSTNLTTVHHAIST